MLIEMMPRVLMWNGNHEVFVRVYGAYVDLLTEALEELLSRLAARQPVIARCFHDLVEQSTDDAFLRVLTAPEVSNRLLWSSGEPDDARVLFILRSLRAETARGADGAIFEEETWTALGDMAFLPGGKTFSYPQLQGMMPLDFGSPLAQAVDLGSPSNIPSEHRPPFQTAEVEQVMWRLSGARDKILHTDPAILDFAVQFNKVLVLQKDPAEPDGFSSGSTGQYVGRSFVTNPHLPNVTDVEFAEALVHEGIHALLYMQERRKAWVFNEDLYAPIPRIESPWTGSRLAIRPFLQACFVWYGLLHFWSRAFQATAFDGNRMRVRMFCALKGFLKGPLTAHLEPYRWGISPELLEAIDEMQSRIKSVFEEVDA